MDCATNQQTSQLDQIHILVNYGLSALDKGQHKPNYSSQDQNLAATVVDVGGLFCMN